MNSIPKLVKEWIKKCKVETSNEPAEIVIIASLKKSQDEKISSLS